MSDGLHIELADGLIALAGFISANPELAEDMRFDFSRINVPLISGEVREKLAAFARAGKASGVEVAKEFNGDDWAGLLLRFGEHVGIAAYAARNQVCERVVTGTREVEEEIVDPAAPKIKRSRTEEIVEWRCTPLLAEVGGAS